MKVVIVGLNLKCIFIADTKDYAFLYRKQLVVAFVEGSDQRVRPENVCRRKKGEGDGAGLS